MGAGQRQGLRRAFAVVGHPVAHSLSPVMHRAAYAALGVVDARYEDPVDVPLGALGAFLAGPGEHLDGLSVTMPLKPEAHALASERDAVSAELGIANTLLHRGDGSWRAENHDVAGIVRAVADHGARAPRSGGVLGSGATALSAVAALAELGATSVSLTARSPEKLAPLERLARARGLDVRIVAWERRLDVLSHDAVVSALAIDGARDVAREMTAIPARERPWSGVLLDVLYDPWPAPIAQAAMAHGMRVVSGLEMLAHQAALQVESMLGVSRAPVEEMLRAAQAEIDSRS